MKKNPLQVILEEETGGSIITQLQDEAAKVGQKHKVLDEIDKLVENSEYRFKDLVPDDQISIFQEKYRKKLMQTIFGEQKVSTKEKHSSDLFYFLKPKIQPKKIVSIVLFLVGLFFGVLAGNFVIKSLTPPKTPAIEIPADFNVSESLSVDVQGEYGYITVDPGQKVSKIILYEGGAVIGSIEDAGTLSKKVFHEEGSGKYVYFAEVYLGTKKFVTDQVAVNY